MTAQPVTPNPRRNARRRDAHPPRSLRLPPRPRRHPALLAPPRLRPPQLQGRPPRPLLARRPRPLAHRTDRTVPRTSTDARPCRPSMEHDDGRITGRTMTCREASQRAPTADGAPATATRPAANKPVTSLGRSTPQRGSTRSPPVHWHLRRPGRPGHVPAFYGDWSTRQLWGRRPGPTPTSPPVRAVRRPADEVDPPLPRRGLDQDRSPRWAPTTIKTRFVIVRSVFRAAVSDRIIANDPSVGVALPGDARPTPPCGSRPSRRSACCYPMRTARGSRPGGLPGVRRALRVRRYAQRRGRCAPGRRHRFPPPPAHVSRQLQRDGATFAVRPPKYGSERVVSFQTTW